jgi:hypothetical protein
MSHANMAALPASHTREWGRLSAYIRNTCRSFHHYLEAVVEKFKLQEEI